MALSAQLGAARSRIGYSQEDAAHALGVSRAMLSYWESGKREPNARQLAALAGLYRVGLDVLVLGGDLNPEGDVAAMLPQHEQRQRDHELGPDFRVEKDQRRNQITHRDPLQHTRNPHVRKIKIRNQIQQESQPENDRGTLEHRFDTDFSSGSVIGKTGTLGNTDGGVSALAGEINTRNGRLLFVIFNQRGSVSRFRSFQNNYVSLIQGQFGGAAPIAYTPTSLDSRMARTRFSYPGRDAAND